jgi:hypothetical protein
MKNFILIAICGCAWAQSGLNRPQLGKMLDANGAVRTVYGIASSVQLGSAEATEVVSSGCSNTLCLAKTSGSIVSAMGSVAAPAGPALFAFNGGSAYVWFSESRQLAQWSGGALTFLDSVVDGEVLSMLAGDAGKVQFAVRRLRGDFIVNLDGSVVDTLPRSTGPVMLLAGAVVYEADGELVVRGVRFPLKGVTAMFPMSGSYLQVRAGGVDYSLRVDLGRETLFQLPGVVTGVGQ